MNESYIPITFKVPYIKQLTCSLQQSFEVGIIILTLHTGKWRHRKSKEFVQGHTPSKWQSWGLNSA